MVNGMQEKNEHMHSVINLSSHDVKGTMTEVSPTNSRKPRNYTIDIHTEDKDEHQSQESDSKYTSRFVILSNAGTSIVTAGISAGIAIAIAYNKCGN